MNTLIDQFVKDCIWEIQNISYCVDGNKETISWFSEEELETIFELSKYLVLKYLTTHNILWIIEKESFADNIEKAIIICMAIECLLRIIDDKRRAERINKDSRFEGFVTDKVKDDLKKLQKDYEETYRQLMNGMIIMAEQFPGKPLAN